MRRAVTSILFTLLVACAGGEGVGETDEPLDTDPVEEEPWSQPAGGEISVETTDGKTIYAQYHPSPVEGAPAIVLLHGHNQVFDHAQWDVELVEALIEREWTVILPDLRGVGKSDGNWYDGMRQAEKWFDVEALVWRAEADGYALGSIVMTGDSGETGMLYARVAEQSDAHSVPACMVFVGASMHSFPRAQPGSVRIRSLFFTGEAEREEPWAQVHPDLWEFEDTWGYISRQPPYNAPGLEAGRQRILTYLDEQLGTSQ